MGTLRAERVAKDTVKSVLRREASVGALTLFLGVALFALQAGLLLPKLQSRWGQLSEVMRAPGVAAAHANDSWDTAWQGP